MQVNKIDVELAGVRSVGIGGHIRPDGDCVGSCMGLYLYLRKCFPQIEADVYLEEIPTRFSVISGTENIIYDCSEDKVYDLFIALDCGDSGRLGDAEKYFHLAKKTICYDHHISNKGYADVNYIDGSISSASELIYHVMDPENITKEIAEALYMGIAHDTGIFQYTCTSPETMEIAASLMRKGINYNYLIDHTYMEKTYLQNQVMGRALMESILVLDKKCILSVFRRKDMEFYNIKPTDLDGIVSVLRQTVGVEVAVFMYELKPQEFKVSLRSKSIVDVAAIACYFGGGGHVRAAGCTMQGTFYDISNSITEQIEKQLSAVMEEK